eukprot:TRINITY_DN3340_c0_g1_i2.p1 TRINITY_DN3340_c0_g1~~TRINITY_DN3340_c0_g1_i2.p1  ORF type:complete len:840 (-),score=265.46 TRINITY_DN3340_c0_g1_i2:21-2540(-)
MYSNNSPQNDFNVEYFESFETVSKREIDHYSSIFERIDVSRTGFLGGEVAKSFFPLSGIPKNQLAIIWRTADVDSDMRLSQTEFVLAMHLIIAALLGWQIPTSWEYPLPNIQPKKAFSPSLNSNPQRNPSQTVNYPSLPVVPASSSTFLPTAPPLSAQNAPRNQPNSNSPSFVTGPIQPVKALPTPPANKAAVRAQFATAPYPQTSSNSTFQPSKPPQFPPQNSNFSPPNANFQLQNSNQNVNRPPSQSQPPPPSYVNFSRHAPPPKPGMQSNPAFEDKTNVVHPQEYIPFQKMENAPEVARKPTGSMAGRRNTVNTAKQQNTAVQPVQEIAPVYSLDVRHAWPKHQSFVQNNNLNQKTVVNLPKPVQVLVNFVRAFAKEDFNGVVSFMSVGLKDFFPLDQLKKLRMGMGDSKQCRLNQAHHFVKGGNSIIYIPFTCGYQKWTIMGNINGGQLYGFYLRNYAGESWPELSEGLRPEVIDIDPPKRVLCYDGSILEIRNDAEEEAAMLNPNVPLGIAVGDHTFYHVKMHQDNQFTGHNVRAITYIPPELSGQSVFLETLMGEPGREDLPQYGVLVLWPMAGHRQSVFTIEYKIAMRPTNLSPLYEGETFVVCPPLSQAESAALTAPTRSLDFGGAIFSNWLSQNGLYFYEGETIISFAMRAYQHISLNFNYLFPSADKLSEIVLKGSGDCGGLNKVFVGIMRANRIPARLLYGRHAKSVDPRETVTWGTEGNITDSGIPYSQTHVQSQFYVENVGWIPVDATFCVQNKNPSWNPELPSSLLFGFGSDRGTFITFSSMLVVDSNVNKSLLDTNGIFDNPQGFSTFGKHKTNSEGYTVERTE